MSAGLKEKAVVVLNISDAGKHRSVDDENKERREFSGGGYGRGGRGGRRRHLDPVESDHTVPHQRGP